MNDKKKKEGIILFKKNTKLWFMLLMSIVVLVACGNNNELVSEEKVDNDTMKVVSTFTIITNMAEEIGGDKVDVYNLVPTGTDPHEYDPLPDDIKAATDADVLFYNGLNLEGADSGWFAKMIDSVGQDWENTFELTKGVEPAYITSSDGREEEVNPHAFIDPQVGLLMAENMRDAFVAIDPDNEDTYVNNASLYMEKVEEIANEYEEKMNEIPEENRILVTSERAYQYLAKSYGLKEGYIWAIDTEENGSPEQIKSLLNFIEENNPPVLFLETNVDERPMETVSNESGLEIFGELYSDEIGEKGEDIDTYVKFLQYNIDTIHEGLMSE